MKIFRGNFFEFCVRWRRLTPFKGVLIFNIYDRTCLKIVFV